VRAPVDHIHAPPFPIGVPWINTAPLRMDQQIGRPVLIEFWDFCRPNSIRTQPYLRAWHERYAEHGLRVIGAHASGFEPSKDPEAVRSAVDRLGIEYPVLVDVKFELWLQFGNLGWPARYLFDANGCLFEYHHGEGAYAETEQAIQELLGTEGPTVPPLRPEDAPDAVLVPQSEDVAGPYQGPYEAGAVWAVLDGAGTVVVQGSPPPVQGSPPPVQGSPPPVQGSPLPVQVDHPGAYELISHPHSTAGTLAMEIGAGVRCHAVCFTPGLAEL
jgi:hypothetical protein